MALRRSRGGDPARKAWRPPWRQERRVGITGQAAAHTERGEAREVNQDRYGMATGVFAVADGVGGHAGGGQAAELVIQHAVRLAVRVQRALARSRRDAKRGLLAEIPARCQALLRDQAAAQDNLGSMATTLTLAVVAWPHAYVVNAGDSRCYLFRGGTLAQITRDQTVAADLLAAGALQPDEAARSPMRNVLSSSVSAGDHDVVPGVQRVKLRQGDWLLLTTDGLHEVVSESDMAAVLSRAPSAEAASRELVEAARVAHARDDATAVAVQLDGTQSA